MQSFPHADLLKESFVKPSANLSQISAGPLQAPPEGQRRAALSRPSPLPDGFVLCHPCGCSFGAAQFLLKLLRVVPQTELASEGVLAEKTTFCGLCMVALAAAPAAGWREGQ